VVAGAQGEGRVSEPGESPQPRARALLLLVLALAGAAIVHWPALHSDFRHDDWLTFYQAANLRPIDFVLLPHAGHLMMTRNAIHLAFFELFDLDPFPYFVAALATHLVNVALLFLLVRRLTASAGIAAFAAALWGMAPVQQASVNWVALYGNVLVATFTLWPLVEIAQLAAQKRPPSALAFVRWGILLMAAATSFGPGFAAALVFPGVAWLLLPSESGRNRALLALSGVALAVVAVYLAIRPGGTLELADFWLSRLGVVSIARVFAGLWSYGIASLVGGPWLTFAEDGVPLGPLAEAAPLDPLAEPDAAPLERASWVVAALVCAGIAWVWLRAGALERRQMLGLLLLIAAIQGLVAIARTFAGMWLIGLDQLVVTARYQYVATAAWSACFGLALAVLARSLRAFGTAQRAQAWVAPAALAAWIIAIVVPYATAARRVDWETTAPSRRKLEAERAWLEQQIAGAGADREVLIENRQFEGMEMLQPLLTGQEYPGSAAVFLFLQHNAPHKATNVKFIERDPAVVADLRARPHTKIADLLVTPEEAVQHAAER
jgi:hypothetical protein